jgi:signal transduction histidine kinase/DNA-binding NarL/FixJ family response regulator
MAQSAKTRLLIIEDNPSDSVLIMENMHLEDPEGYEFIVAENLSEGIKAGKKFDAVFIDLWLPDSTGIETLKKYIEKMAGVPVIVLTGMDNAEISIKAIKAGADDYLVKDYVDGKLLVRAVRYAIERKTIRESLVKSTRDLMNVIDNIPVMIFLVDGDMKVQKANNRALRFIRSTESETIGAHIGKAIKCKNCWGNELECGASVDCRKCPIRLVAVESFENGTNVERVELSKTFMINGGPETDYFFMSAIPVAYNGKKVVLISFEDTTIRKKSEARMQEAMQRLQELDGLKSNFISMISHELRTPITSIKGFLAFLIAGAAGPNTETQREYLEIIRNNSERLHALINDVLDMSKMESGTFSIDQHFQDVAIVIDRALREVSGLAVKNKMKLIKEVGKFPIMANLDEFRIIQVIVNLVGNAVKFSTDGSELVIGAKDMDYNEIQFPDYAQLPEIKSGRYVLIYVRDQGAGIDHEHISKIFNKFYQANGDDSRVLKGVGLGLNISSNIVLSHGGSIWAESEGRGRGSVFKFILPA